MEAAEGGGALEATGNHAGGFEAGGQIRCTRENVATAKSAAVSGPASEPACRRRAAFMLSRCSQKSAGVEPQEFVLLRGGTQPLGEPELVQSCFFFFFF